MLFVKLSHASLRAPRERTTQFFPIFLFISLSFGHKNVSDEGLILLSRLEGR